MLFLRPTAARAFLACVAGFLALTGPILSLSLALGGPAKKRKASSPPAKEASSPPAKKASCPPAKKAESVESGPPLQSESSCSAKLVAGGGYAAGVGGVAAAGGLVYHGLSVQKAAQQVATLSQQMDVGLTLGKTVSGQVADAMVVGRNFITTAENGVRALQPALDFTANMNTGVSLATTPVRGAVSAGNMVAERAASAYSGAAAAVQNARDFLVGGVAAEGVQLAVPAVQAPLIAGGEGAAQAAAAAASSAASSSSAGGACGAGASSASNAKAVLDGARMSTTARWVAGVGGTIGVVAGVAEISMSINELLKGHPTEQSCDQLQNRIANLQESFAKEPDSPQKTALLATLSQCARDDVEKLRGQLRFHNAGTNVSKIGGGALGAAGGGCLVGAAACPVGAPVLLPVGAALSLAGGVTSVSATIADSHRWYEFRGKLRDLHDKISKTIKNYARQQAPHVLLHRPDLERLLRPSGRFRFSGGGSCQTHMIIEYSLPESPHERVIRKSSDGCTVGEWYDAEVRIDPGAYDVVVWFDVRGGLAVKAWDRYAKKQDWRHANGKKYVEKFSFPAGNGLDCFFELAGTSLHRAVMKAEQRGPEEGVEVKML